MFNLQFETVSVECEHASCKNTIKCKVVYGSFLGLTSDYRYSFQEFFEFCNNNNRTVLYKYNFVFIIVINN